MSEKPVPLKAKYEELIKELRVQKSLSALEKIYEDLKSNKDSLYDNNVIPFQYSDDLLWFLQHHLIKIETQMDIFKLYIDGLFEMKCKPEDLLKIHFMTTIFQYDSDFYKSASNIENFLVFLNKFFNIYYPKNTTKTHEVGDVMDILINDERFNMNLLGWIQMPIKRIDQEKKLYIFEDYKDSSKELMIAMDNFKVQEKNVYAKEEEISWRNNLKVGDKVDYLTANLNWVEGNVDEINEKGEIKIKALGEIDQNICFLNKYSPFFQPLYKHSYKFESDEEMALTLIESNKSFQKYNFIPYNDINHLVPIDVQKFFSLEYYELLNYFINKIISTKILENESLPIEYIYTILTVLYMTHMIVNQSFTGKYFQEKVYDNVKKNLLDYSLNKKKNIPKLIIDNILAYSDTFLGFNCYSFQLLKTLTMFIIEFGYNCFKTSESLEKRLLGINAILRTMPFINLLFPVISNKTVSELTALISDKLLNNSGDNDLFGLLFNSPDIHEQLLFKGVEVIKNLSKLKFLDDKDIDRLYNLALSYQEDSDLFKYIYDLLNNITADFSVSQAKVIFEKIITFPYDKIRKNDINLVQNILQNIKSKDDFRSMAKTFLDYYYNYMVDFKKKDQSLVTDFGKIISFANDQENLEYLYIFYFEKVMNEITKQNTLEDYFYYFTLLHSVFHSLDIKEEKNGLNKNPIIIKYKEIFYKEYNNFEVIVDKILYLNSLNKDNENNEKYIIDLKDIVKGFFQFIKDNHFYTVESMVKLFEFFIFGDTIKKNKIDILYSIKNMSDDEIDKKKLYDIIFNKLDAFFDTITPENVSKLELLGEKFPNMIYSFYTEVNQSPLIVESKQPEDALNNAVVRLTEKVNPLETKYFDIIWKMFLKYNKPIGKNEFLDVFSLKNFSPSERHEIWEKLVKKIFSCIDNSPNTSLKMIEKLLEISEKYGSAGVHSHLIESRIPFDIHLNQTNTISVEMKSIDKYINTNINSNSTIYDLKKELQKKYGIDPIFFDLKNLNDKTNTYANRDTNAIPLFKFIPSLSPHSNDVKLIIKKSSDFNNIYTYPLMKDSSLTDKFLEVLREIFNRFAKDGKLDIVNFKKYFNASMNLIATNTSLENTAIEAFHKFDMGKKGYWTLDDLILFQGSAIESKQNSIFLNLNNLGYTRSLDYYLAPLKKDCPLYYEENNVKEFMPRYFIGNNKEYMGKLFILAKNEDKSIHSTAQNIIQEVCTLEEMKKTLFENDNKIDQILSNNNLELRAYAYDILLTEFCKNEKKKDESTEKMINNFINNNLYKIISELDKFNKDENKEDNKLQIDNSQFSNFYLSNLKLIYYGISNILENKPLNNMVDKYEDINDDNEKNKFQNVKIELDEEKINLIKNLHFPILINSIGNNFLTLNNSTSASHKNAISLSAKIFIYIILLSQNLPEEEKTNIYNNFLKYLIKLTQSSSFLVKHKMFIVNKLLLFFMNEEKDQKYILLENELLTKEMLKYQELNALSGRLMFFFRLLNDLYDLSIKDKHNDDIYKFFEELLNIILDNNITLNEYILSGYLSTIKRILTILKDSKYPKIMEYDFETLINKLINDFIITYEKDENNKVTDLDKLKKYSKYTDNEYLCDIYQILNIFISINPEKYLKVFFENDEIKNVVEKHLSKLDEEKNNYSPKSESISSTGFVGIKNLSSLCYMNSVIQQFFMMPLFKNAILSLPIDPSLKEEDDNDILLFQLQKMFHYLKYSKKEHYNPKSFVYSFKDYEGNPTNINIQCDAQEFLSRFIEKIEESLKNSPQKYLCDNIVGGSTLQQVKCTNPECGNISERRENINFLSLDIKGCTNVNQCLEKFIVEEKIEDYHCEKCDKKITNLKRVLVDKIPNILIIHLQRIAFSYETFTMEKINIPIDFDKNLNMKKYTLNRDNNDIPSEYYDYELQGIIIHKGTAQFGHYYSIIYSEEKDLSGKWYKFNDTSVTEVNYDQIIDDASGSYNEYDSSAYMLIYQKKNKKPVIINCKEINENKKKILEENKEKNLEKLDLEGKEYYLYDNDKEAVEKNINYTNGESKEKDKDIIIKNGETECNLVTYEEAIDSLQKINNESNDKRPFINSILLENVKLCNDKKFFLKGFTIFIKDMSEIIKKIIIEDKTNTKINEYIPILKTFNNYIFNIISLSFYKDELNIIVQNITDIYRHSVPKELLSYLIKDIIEPKIGKIFKNYLVARDRIMGNDISKYVGRIVGCGLDNNIESETCTKIIQFYVDKIPVEITKHWIDMEPFNNLILEFIEHSDVVKKIFLQNQMISKLIDFILGRNSPLYQGDDRVENKINKGKFGPIVKGIALLFKYYAENHEKEEIKLSPADLKMINHRPFYEKVVLDDFDNNACNLLIDNKMKLSLILNKEDNNEDFDAEILDILIKLKIPSIKKHNEIISCLELILNLMKKYTELYLNKENSDEHNKAKNKELFLEKLNIILGLPILTVNSGEAEIKFISGKYQEQYTILTNISKEKETNKDILPLLTSIFNLLNVNEMIFTYVDNLPAPNSLKYSYVDYLLKLFILTEKETEAAFNVHDEMGINNPLKELANLINDVCKKNNKDINLIKENDTKINIKDSLYFKDFSCQVIKNVGGTEKLSIIEMTIDYCTMKDPRKIDVPCFNKKNYFYNLVGRKGDANSLKEDGLDQHTLLCILICCNDEIDVTISFKPYIYSKLEIKGKKEYHYFLYCMDYDDHDKKIDYNNMNIDVKDNKPLSLPPADNNYDAAGYGNECTVNCPLCGTANVLDESNKEYKCVFCEANLF